jgi:hypothetical protein
MAVYFKFNSWNQKNFDTIVLDGAPFISVAELKQQIIKKKKLEKGVGLVLTNAQSHEGLCSFYEHICWLKKINDARVLGARLLVFRLFDYLTNIY